MSKEASATRNQPRTVKRYTRDEVEKVSKGFLGHEGLEFSPEEAKTALRYFNDELTREELLDLIVARRDHGGT